MQEILMMDLESQFLEEISGGGWIGYLGMVATIAAGVDAIGDAVSGFADGYSKGYRS
ncbi:hypothetical protein [Chromobacterium sp. IIBBL 290-4]|uniref:hypothetical protein n=1 Tax=Chromobacterium sp. IIBBL 290-4 TaxID=2953890 RepID=UPI0020B82C22|nr:hypothetical protein [Chromobacterium sp. IIBBL 290-4]UTH73542.1 hypothetical protein NKT35_18675 [Chromobacterium sp. IIBBL 290-4]